MYKNGKQFKWIAMAALCCLTVILTGCQSKGKKVTRPVANGTWAATDGVYTAIFQNGNFRATANDTGETISVGNYIVKSDTQLKISWQGAVSRTLNSAECIKPDTEQMNCVDQNGKSFGLRRTSLTIQ